MAGGWRRLAVGGWRLAVPGGCTCQKKRGLKDRPGSGVHRGRAKPPPPPPQAVTHGSSRRSTTFGTPLMYFGTPGGPAPPALVRHSPCQCGRAAPEPARPGPSRAWGHRAPAGTRPPRAQNAAALSSGTPAPLRPPTPPSSSSGRRGRRRATPSDRRCVSPSGLRWIAAAPPTPPHTHTHTHTHADDAKRPDHSKAEATQALVISRFSSGRWQSKRSHGHRRLGTHTRARAHVENREAQEQSKKSG